MVEGDKVKKDKKQKSIELFIIYTLLCISRKGNESYGDFQYLNQNKTENGKYKIEELRLVTN